VLHFSGDFLDSININNGRLYQQLFVADSSRDCRRALSALLVCVQAGKVEAQLAVEQLWRCAEIEAHSHTWAGLLCGDHWRQ